MREKGSVPARRPRLLIADPHDGFRRSLAAHLHAQFEIVAVVADVASLGRRARAGSPDVIVCDLSLLPSAERWARRRRRPPGPGIGIVALSLHDEPALARRLRRPGLAGCVPKWAAASELGPAIHAALARPGDLRNRQFYEYPENGPAVIFRVGRRLGPPGLGGSPRRGAL